MNPNPGVARILQQPRRNPHQIRVSERVRHRAATFPAKVRAVPGWLTIGADVRLPGQPTESLLVNESRGVGRRSRDLATQGTMALVKVGQGAGHPERDLAAEAFAIHQWFLILCTPQPRAGRSSKIGGAQVNCRFHI